MTSCVDIYSSVNVEVPSQIDQQPEAFDSANEHVRLPRGEAMLLGFSEVLRRVSVVFGKYCYGRLPFEP